MKLLFTILILGFKTYDLFAQEELRQDWIKLDSVIYRNLINTLASDNLSKDKDSFFKNFKKLNIDKKDLGFGLTLFECVQYGGYATARFEILVYENQIIKYKIGYDDDDTRIVDYLLKKDNSLKLKTAKLKNSDSPYEYNFIDSLKYQSFQKRVAENLGELRLKIDTTNRDFQSNFTILTEPTIEYAFGSSCGFGGVDPIGRKAINYFASFKNNADIFRELIKGYNPEGRIYAIEALLNLAMNKKIVLSKEDKQVIKKVLSLKIPIYECSGCIHMNSTASEVLDPQLKKFLKKI